MPEQLPSHFIDLVQDALLKSFWRKNTLLNFLRRHKIAEGFLATWQETETKRVFVGRLFPKLVTNNGVILFFRSTRPCARKAVARLSLARAV